MLRLGYKPAFLRQFKKLPTTLREEATEKIGRFRENPQDPVLHVHKLKGSMKGRLSFSVNYAYRIVFIYTDENTVVLLAIGDHSVYD